MQPVERIVSAGRNMRPVVRLAGVYALLLVAWLVYEFGAALIDLAERGWRALA